MVSYWLKWNKGYREKVTILLEHLILCMYKYMYDMYCYMQVWCVTETYHIDINQVLCILRILDRWTEGYIYIAFVLMNLSLIPSGNDNCIIHFHFTADGRINQMIIYLYDKCTYTCVNRIGNITVLFANKKNVHRIKVLL